MITAKFKPIILLEHILVAMSMLMIVTLERTFVEMLEIHQDIVTLLILPLRHLHLQLAQVEVVLQALVTMLCKELLPINHLVVVEEVNNKLLKELMLRPHLLNPQHLPGEMAGAATHFLFS